MIRLLLVLALVGLAVWLVRRARQLDAHQRRQLFTRGALATALVSILLLAATGRLHWLLAAAAAALPLLRHLVRLVGPWLAQTLMHRVHSRRARQQGEQRQSAYRDQHERGRDQHESEREQRESGREQRDRRPTGGAMDRAEALATLGLAEGATRQEIITAHRRLIQRLHPDRGGSDHLAARINAAKDALVP